MGRKNEELVADQKAKKLTEQALKASYEADKANQELAELKAQNAAKLAEKNALDPEVFDKLAEIEAKDEQAFAAERLTALEKFKKRRLNAHEARNLADQSLVQLNRLYKTIKEQAVDGYSRVDWCVCYVSDACIERLLKELKLDGYQVNYLQKEQLIVITW